MTAPSLPAIRALLEGVTPPSTGGLVEITKADRDFYAAAPSIVAQLLAVVERVEGLAKEWEAMAVGTTQFDSALRVCALKARAAITGEGQ